MKCELRLGTEMYLVCTLKTTRTDLSSFLLNALLADSIARYSGRVGHVLAQDVLLDAATATAHSGPLGALLCSQTLAGRVTSQRTRVATVHLQGARVTPVQQLLTLFLIGIRPYAEMCQTPMT